MYTPEDRQFIKSILLDTLSEVGLITPYMTRDEVIDQVGRRRYDRAVKSGIIRRRKNAGRNAKVEINRSEFSQMLKLGKI